MTAEAGSARARPRVTEIPDGRRTTTPTSSSTGPPGGCSTTPSSSRSPACFGTVWPTRSSTVTSTKHCERCRSTGSARRACTYPSSGSPLRYLAIGPTGAFIITPTNGRWTRGRTARARARRAGGRPAPSPHTTSRRRGSGSCSRPTIRPSVPQVLGIPGARRIWLIKADELYAHLLTHVGAGPCRGDLTRLAQGTGGETAGRRLRHSAVADHRRHGQSRRRTGRRSTTEAAVRIPNDRQPAAPRVRGCCPC